MLDFLRISHRINRAGVTEIVPDFVVGASKDLMIRGGAFYAVWNQKRMMWSTSEYDVKLLVDEHLRKYTSDLVAKEGNLRTRILFLSDFSNGMWNRWKLYTSKLSDHFVQLDEKIVFSNDDVTKKDHVTKRLPYPLSPGPTVAFDTLFSTLYSEEELQKIMWSIGSIVSGDSRKIQKFFVFYGLPGTGKSTVLNLVELLFPGYCTNFDAKSLTSPSNTFSVEMFRNNPLIGLNHEGDLSVIKDNSLLNSIVSHDNIVMNVKYQSSYPFRVNALLFIATNKPVSITDSRSGLIRRLIDIHPTGTILSPDAYFDLVGKLEFELGAIAHKCLMVYQEMGPNYYSRYKPRDMMMKTNVVYNFVDDHFLMFSSEDSITLSRAWALYNDYCEKSGIKYKLSRYQFRDDFMGYWDNFFPYKKIAGTQYRSLYMGFNRDLYMSQGSSVHDVVDKDVNSWLDMEETSSLLDVSLSDCPAQLANDSGTPVSYWANVDTVLQDIDTSELHFILPPSNHVVIDFDKKVDGKKSLEANIKAARTFPPTYAEVSKGGQGLHLHYWYEGSVEDLSRIYDDGIEILAPVGNFSIRRRLTLCNSVEIATINSGLPLKETKPVISEDVVRTERSIRKIIMRNLNKEIHPATTPSVNFIVSVLEEAKNNGVHFDVTDMKKDVVTFASNSTNQANHCLRLALNAPYSNIVEVERNHPKLSTVPKITFFDIEMFPNLFVVCWKYDGADKNVQRMINPSPADVGILIKEHNLVGFNNRRYDNHILYAAYLGYSVEDLFKISSRIVSNDRDAFFREAYSLSYTDVLDYSSTKQSLKKWQVELGLNHKELELPWDEPVPEEMWGVVADYCVNDVTTLEDLHHHLEPDFNARLILAELSGLTPNDSTLRHTSRILFGNDKNPQSEFNYPDLSLEFPGYSFDAGVSTYRGEIVGEGGYVYAEPGIYRDVLYMDIASMHPTTIEKLNLFGRYTEKYSEIKRARLCVKHGDFETAKSMFGGILSPYLTGDKKQVKALDFALKIILNIVYGMTFASFPNAFRDNRNIDNVVAKRGALFMVDLKHFLKEHNINCVHFKTDSVKIANYKSEDIQIVKDFAAKYGYEFEVEGVYDVMALLNNADLIGKWARGTSRKSGKWDAVGARMSHPYIFKILFSKEPIEFKDLVEIKEVKAGTMYLDLNGTRQFIGKVGTFCPMLEPHGGMLYRVKDGKDYSVTRTKGFLWLPSDMVRGPLEDFIDFSYFKHLVDDAITTIKDVGDISMLSANI